LRDRQRSRAARFAADTAYGISRFLDWLVSRRIAPHIPVRDASERDDGTFSRSDFHWDWRRDVYICPNNKVLHTSGTAHEGYKLIYRASKFDCEVLRTENAMLSQCTVAPSPPRCS
jgi:acetone carboxylase gamma subunit